MTVLVNDPDFTLHLGDVLEVLAGLEDESVHCVVTSPPYWGLRDYGTGSWVGGNESCDHKHETEHQKQGATSVRSGRANVEEQRNENFRESCGKCGARRQDQQLGLEPTPDQYVANMVGVFREVRRVLRKDGTCWLNIGDSYASGEVGRVDAPHKNVGLSEAQKPRRERRIEQRTGLKPKDLVGVPWRLAFALQQDGWYLRSEIIWAKPNPMPESVTDRPTKSHEQVFLLTRSPRYFYDADAVREPHTAMNIQRQDSAPKERGDSRGFAKQGLHDFLNPLGRNLRSVWNIATEPYPDAHFATFPQALVEPCVKAGCPEGGLVLDPFMGSGTVALVARRLGRRSIGIELNPAYAQLCVARTRQLSLLAGAAR